MPKPRRLLQETDLQTTSPPAILPPNQHIARVVKNEGKNLYTVSLPTNSSNPDRSPNDSKLLVELPSRFRSTIWLKRDGFVVVDLGAFGGRENKIQGEIVNVVRDERAWRKMRYWPLDFVKKLAWADTGEEEDSVVGKMPPEEDIEDEGEKR
ncbi:hypothetical protein MMC09_000712 [Bachmanniomyces sp. S44760]|nr:hypothetical protein [Bachmanniomyces sp. S44760]